MATLATEVTKLEQAEQQAKAAAQKSMSSNYMTAGWANQQSFGGLLGSACLNEDIALVPQDWYMTIHGNGVRATRLSVPKENRDAIIRAAIKALRAQLKNA